MTIVTVCIAALVVLAVWESIASDPRTVAQSNRRRVRNSTNLQSRAQFADTYRAESLRLKKLVLDQKIASEQSGVSS